MTRSAPSDDFEALIALSLVPGLGPTRTRALVEAFGSPRRVLAATATDLARVRGVGPVIAREIRELKASSDVARQLCLARRVGAEPIGTDSSRYPPLLRQIFDPPHLLWTRGREALLLDHAVAVVGTRRPTREGKRTAFEIARGLSELGYVVVSGLAYGIDTAAHRGALAGAGTTVAVLGSGVDVVYPSANRDLFRTIVGSGLVLSEFPLRAKPEAVNFPKRNRIISGMSLGVVVVETYEEGGGLITARMALEQNREVFAVPGSVRNPASGGCNLLIRDGAAKLVTSVEDIVVELQAAGAPTRVTRGPTRGAVQLSDAQRRILACLGAEPVHLDRLAAAAEMTIPALLAHLLALEMKGVVAQTGGKLFYLHADVQDSIGDNH